MGKIKRQEFSDNFNTELDNLQRGVNVKDFGAIGDGVADDTVAIQTCLDNTDNTSIYFDGLFKISSGLVVPSHIKSIIFNNFSYGSGTGSGFLVVGSGYTALTINSNINFIGKNITIHGGNSTAPQINGILFQNSKMSEFTNIRVYNLDGYGIKINKMWDCICTNFSIEKCGNATEYAFSINDDGDTTNHTIFNRIQVEQSNTKAMYISGNTLNCEFNDIHSERTTGDGSNYTHSLRGNNCTYTNARIEATSNVKILLGCASGSYKDFRCSSTDIILDVGTGSVNCEINGLICANLTVEGADAYINLRNINVTSTFKNSYLTKVKVYNSKLVNINNNGNNTVTEITDSPITGTYTVSGNNTIRLRNVTSTNMPSSTTVVLKDNTVITNAYSTVTNQNITAKNSTFSGNITLNANGARFYANDCIFNGNLLYNAGTAFGYLDSKCKFIGTTSINSKWTFEEGTSVRNFGVTGDGSTDDTVLLQNIFTMLGTATFLGNLYFPKGTYKITDTITKAQSGSGISIKGECYDNTIISYTGFATKKAALLYIGGSGTLSDITIRGIQFLGSSSSVGIELRGQCNVKINKCQFNTNAVGILLSNDVGAGTFTEFNVAENCDFKQACNIALEYYKGAGDNSFHGSGLLSCIINQSATETEPKIKIGADCQPYNAPLDFTCFNRANTPIIQNLGKTTTNFYGNLRFERFTNSAEIVDSANNVVYIVGDYMCNNQNVQRGKAVFCDKVVMNSDGSLTAQKKPYNNRYALTTGANNTAIFSDGYITSFVQLRVTASNYEYVYMLMICRDYDSSAGSITVLNTHRAFNTAGYGAPTLDFSGDYLTISNNNFPASGVNADIDVFPMNARTQFRFL